MSTLPIILLFCEGSAFRTTTYVKERHIISNDEVLNAEANHHAIHSVDRVYISDFFFHHYVLVLMSKERHIIRYDESYQTDYMTKL